MTGQGADSAGPQAPRPGSLVPLGAPHPTSPLPADPPDPQNGPQGVADTRRPEVLL